MRLTVLVILALHLSGCAISYVDSEGATRRIGLLSVTEKSGPCSIVRTITTAGLSLDTTPATAGLSLGYRSVTLTQPPADGAIAFEMDSDGQLLSYARTGAMQPDGHFSCR